MAQDIRKMLKNDASLRAEKMPEGHRDRFKRRLEQELPEEEIRSSIWMYRIAAVLVVAIGITVFFLFSETPTATGDGFVENQKKQEEQVKNTAVDGRNAQLTLAEISPEFKKVEEYYLAHLNIGLSHLEITAENKALIDTFMAQLSELDQEYGRLNKELREHGFSGETIEALIQNLQLRLDLLYKLNSKLNELKQKKNENYNQTQA